jgi:hypothetical protein
MAAHVYEPLNGATNSIRVLKIAPSNNFGKSPVVCQLEAAVSDTCEYEALSYCWGSRSGRTAILLNGEPFRVTRDLGAALEQLCLPDRIRTIWVGIYKSDDLMGGSLLSLTLTTGRCDMH